MSDFLHSTDRWLPGLVAMLVLMGVSVFLSASETALFFFSHEEIRGFRMGRARERAAAALLSDPDRVLTGILFWNFVVNLLYFAVSIVVSQRLLSAHLHTAAGDFRLCRLLALLFDRRGGAQSGGGDLAEVARAAGGAADSRPGAAARSGAAPVSRAHTGRAGEPSCRTFTRSPFSARRIWKTR